MAQVFLAFAAIFGMSGVILGAFGAHALQKRLPETLLSSYETAVQYQLWHALLLLALGILCHISPGVRLLQISGWTTCVGIILFSGSLYILVLTDIRQIGMVNIGLITPLGGMLLIAGWMFLLATVLIKWN